MCEIASFVQFGICMY